MHALGENKIDGTFVAHFPIGLSRVLDFSFSSMMTHAWGRSFKKVDFRGRSFEVGHSFEEIRLVRRQYVKLSNHWYDSVGIEPTS